MVMYLSSLQMKMLRSNKRPPIWWEVLVSSTLRSTLYYVHDPMCSWCWAFRPAWAQLQSSLQHGLTEEIHIQNSLGGLAPDSEQPMPASLQKSLQGIWQLIKAKVPDTQFNFDFWTECQPRRSTYPACRAVIAASQQGQLFEEQMILAIQQAYYLQARNPSDESTLIQLANEIGLDQSLFSKDLYASQTQERLKQEMAFNQQVGANSFPNLVFNFQNQFHPIELDYLNADTMLLQIQQIIQAH